MRKDFSRDSFSDAQFYQLLTATVVPRPIAWVASRSAAGVDNLAPHSFYTVASVKPPVLQFTSVGCKDTLNNIRETGEFTVNLATERLFEKVNATGTAFGRDVSEFDAVNLTREPSLTVAVPRVKESPVSVECLLNRIIPVGDCFIVLGEVLHAAVDEDALEDNHPLIGKLQPLSRLGRDEWGTAGEIRRIARIRAEEWPGHFRG
ncbi:flavin reductase family protein [Arthrobacter tecti]